MLTYRVGSEVGLSGARAMAAHVMEQTVAPEVAAVAAYYAGTPGVDTADPAAFSVTHPTVRRDIDPRVARLLGLDPKRPLTADELTSILAGRRADGGAIAGRRERRYGDALADLLGLPQDRLPSAAEIRSVLAGRRADRDEALPTARVAALQKRFLALYGATPGTSAEAIIAAAERGRRLDGGPLRASHVLDNLGAARARTSFVDLCFSAPKHLSVAWAVAGSHEERAVLHAAHREAVDRTLAVIEKTLGAVRRGKDGRDGREAGKLAWIECPHFTARPNLEIATHDAETGEAYTSLTTVRTRGDPQVHSHILIPAVSLTGSGHVGTPDMALLAGGRVHLWGRLYAAEISTALRRVGVDVSLDPRTGTARLDAVPDSLCEHFSRRSSQGEEAARAYAERKGLEWDALSGPRRVALLKGATQGEGRSGKVDDVGDLSAWQAEAASLGWDGRSVVAVDRPQPLAPRDERMEIACRAAAPILAAEFRTSAVLDEARLHVAAAAGLVAAGIEDADEIEAVGRLILARGIDDDGPVALIARAVRGQHGEAAVRLTTAGHVEREARVIALAKEAGADTSGALTEAEVDAGLLAAGLDLSDDHGRTQRTAAHALGQARLGVLLGVAGSGKTRLLGGLVHAWQRQNRRVYGVALAWRQATALQDAGIAPDDTMALAALLARVRVGMVRLDKDAVLAVDEVGLLSVRDVLALLEIRAETHCTIVAIGDPAQGGAVEAGGAISLLEAGAGRLPTVGSSIRQKAVAERELAALARSGDAVAVLSALRDQDRARLVAGTPADVAEAAAVLWQERREIRGEPPLVLVPSNADARLVSAAIRRRLQASGEIGPNAVEVDAVSPAGEEYVLPLAIGDTVRLYRRTYAKGSRGVVGVNGSVLTVVDVQPGGVALRDRGGRTTFVPWNNLRSDGGRVLLGPGLAMTQAAGQGATSDDAITVMPRGTADVRAGPFYVSMSRHREWCGLLIGEGAERRAVAQRRGLLDARPIRVAEIWAHAGAALSRRDEPETATAFLARTHAIREASAALFRAGAVHLRIRRNAGLEATTLPARRRALAVERLLDTLRAAVAESTAVIAGIAERIGVLRTAAEVAAEREPTHARKPSRGRRPAVEPRAPRR